MLKIPSSNETWESADDEKPDYPRLFEERLENLKPLSEEEGKSVAEKFGLDEINLYPKKFVACILYTPPTEISRS